LSKFSALFFVNDLIKFIEKEAYRNSKHNRIIKESRLNLIITKYTIKALFAAITTFAQTDTLTAEQAKTMINKEVIVKAMVSGARLFDKDGNKTFLINLDKRYSQSPLTVVLYNKAYKELNLQYELQEKDIVVKGTLTLYNDRPQIIVSDVRNLKILK